MIVLMEVDEDWDSSGGESSTGACWLGNGNLTVSLTCLLLNPSLMFRITTSKVYLRLTNSAAAASDLVTNTS